jgi:hypothetical protein
MGLAKMKTNGKNPGISSEIKRTGFIDEMMYSVQQEDNGDIKGLMLSNWNGVVLTERKNNLKSRFTSL